MGQFLYPHQVEALEKIHNGCILCGGTGSGKSRCSLAYYCKQHGSTFEDDLPWGLPYTEIVGTPKDLIIITTAKKRDQAEWDMELSDFWMHSDPKLNHYSNTIIIDSWNNIKKYRDIRDSFFIFDEQRVVGSGTWVNAFLKIAKNNEWILLSATPGDTWSDYIPVFVANGFYPTKTDFNRSHVVYNPYVKYPLIDRYLDEDRLIRCRSRVLVPMDYERSTIQHHITHYASYDTIEYKMIIKERWDPFEEKPIKNASGFCYCLRKSINSNPSRMDIITEIIKDSPRCIIFYNFDYELNILRNAFEYRGEELAEWNGHKHQPVPKTTSWIYLVQYTAGSEGWNCIATDTIIFYSQNYSYKVLTQATGRIDRLNTPYIDLYFHHILSRSGLDLAIGEALKKKKKFNERGFASI